jgi:micrococcal nuclease
MLRTLALMAVTLFGCGGSAQGQDRVTGRTSCTVASVADGDTFRCSDGTRVRLLQIDSPEAGQGAVYGRARQELQRYLVRGRVVSLELDVRPLDQYRRTLAYVWLGDTLVNEAMVQAGWAVQFTLPPNVKYVERIRAAEHAAREHQRGLWADGKMECRPADYRRKKC